MTVSDGSEDLHVKCSQGSYVCNIYSSTNRFADA